jgi:small-conductance mechanosensitive channel
MDMPHLVESFSNTFLKVADQIVEFLPRVLAALLVLFLGWLLARLVRALSVRFISGLDQLWGRVVSRAGLDQANLHLVSAKLIGDILFWFIVLIAFFGAAQILSLGAFTNWVSKVVAYLPSLLAGVLIIILGIAISRLLRSLVETTASSAHIPQAYLLGRAMQVLVIVVAVIVGIAQLGIDISFITVISGIVLGGVCGGIALAYGLGARTYVANVLALHQLRKLFKIGDEVLIQGVSGRIVDFTTIMVVIDTESGEAFMPAAQFMQHVTVAKRQTENA